MKTYGKITGVTRDILTRRMIISFEVDDVPQASIQEIQGKDLTIEADTKRVRRSLNSNNYFHVLAGKMADKLTVSKARMKNLLICKYGQPYLLDDGSPMIYKTNAPPEFMQEQESIHSLPVKYSEENGKQVIFYKVYRPSHEYNTLEMSALIDGTVADAKELGIETLTPLELARMKMRWIQ